MVVASSGRPVIHQRQEGARVARAVSAGNVIRLPFPAFPVPRDHPLDQADRAAREAFEQRLAFLRARLARIADVPVYAPVGHRPGARGRVEGISLSLRGNLATL